MNLDNDTIKKIVSTIKRPYVNAIFLVGSHLYGTETEESDIDLMVILDDNTDIRLKNELRYYGYVFSPIEKNIECLVYYEKDAILNNLIPLSNFPPNSLNLPSPIIKPLLLYSKESKKEFYIS
jgi:predicted nucleotidyltransferase